MWTPELAALLGVGDVPPGFDPIVAPPAANIMSVRGAPGVLNAPRIQGQWDFPPGDNGVIEAVAQLLATGGNAGIPPEAPLGTIMAGATGNEYAGTEPQTPQPVNVPMPLPRPTPGEDISSQVRTPIPLPRPPSNPWTPGPQPPQEVDPRTQATVGAFMSDPRARSALLSFGLSMMGPQRFGGSAMSHIANAVGAAGETVDRNEAMDIKQREAESKADLRGAQATSAEARAAAAAERAATGAARLDTSAARLALTEKEIEAKNARNLLNTRMRLLIGYDKFVKDTAAQNFTLPRDKQIPIPTRQEWIKQNYPFLKGTGLIDDETTDDGADPITSATPTPPANAAPRVGEVRKGFKFLGGDPSQQKNWEKVP